MYGKLGKILESSLASQGVFTTLPGWLDMGSKDWSEVSDEEKAKAYQAAKLDGWTDIAIENAIKELLEARYDEYTGNYTLELLKEAEKKFPVVTEENPNYHARKYTVKNNIK